MNERPDTLQKVEAAVWEQLAGAARDKRHAWRTAVLATVRSDRAELEADARTVVLREVDAQGRALFVYTDERAGKVAQLLSHPCGTLVMWSAALGWQLRCRVWLTLEMSGLAVSSRWARLKLTPAAQDYLAPLPPGTLLDEPAPSPHPVVARDYFAVVNARVQSIDWLELHPDGQRRALFDEQGARWIQP